MKTMFMQDLSSALTVLSAMITPAVLILASGSLSMTTSQRLSRSIDRVRAVAEQIGQLSNADLADNRVNSDKDFLTKELLNASKRCRLMQQAMTSLYLTITTFVVTIIAIGMLEVLGLSYAWVLLVLGFLGVAMLLYACLLLIVETRLALRSVSHEMDYTVKRYLIE